MRHSTTKSKLSKIGGVVAWLLIWQLAAVLKDNMYIIPSPKDTVDALLRLAKEPEFYQSIGITLYRVFVGFFLSAILGIILGVMSGLIKWVHDFIKPFIVVVRATPVMSIIIIIILWAESNNTPIVVAFLMCFPIMWTSTYEGIKNTDPDLLEMAHCFKVPRLDVIKGIYLPSVRPFIISGITMAIGIGWKVTVAAEVISFPKLAIGKELYESKIYIETPDVFAWTLVVIVLSLIFEYAIKYYLKKFNSKDLKI